MRTSGCSVWTRCVQDARTAWLSLGRINSGFKVEFVVLVLTSVVAVRGV